MYSVNVPVPHDVARLASGLASNCYLADVRTRHTLVAKRIGELPDSKEIRKALADTPPFAARITDIEAFHDPPRGAAPVVYLTVESPELYALHDRLCDIYEPVAGFEGEGYDPHVTIARGGDADTLLGSTVEPIEWTVERLDIWDAEYREIVETVSLPV